MELSQTEEKGPVGCEIWRSCGLRSSEHEEGYES